MDIKEIRNIENETERVKAIYDVLNEDIRLKRTRAAGIEFFTTIKYIEKYLKEGMRILELGAGTGAYSLYFARKGYSVSAVELSEKNADILRSRIKGDMDVQLYCRNALDLSVFSDGYFDVVLVLGPLYHLEQEEDRRRCIFEAKRVLKENGTMFFAFVSNDTTILSEMIQNRNFLNGTSYDHDTFKMSDFPFVVSTEEQCRDLLNGCGVQILKAIGVDGVSWLIEGKINSMDDKSFSQFLKYHFYTCEKPEMLGRSMRLLYIGKKL